MIKRKEYSARMTVKALEVELVKKAMLLQQLQEEQEVLAAYHSLLVSICDTLWFLRAKHEEMVTTIDELLLLQQLAGIEYSGPYSRSAELPVLDLSACATNQSICPEEDPFLLMRFISTHDRHPLAVNWQLPDLMRHCSTTVPQLALALTKLEAGLAGDMDPHDDAPSESGDMGDATDGSGASDSAEAPAWVERAGMLEHPLQTIQRIQIEWQVILGTLMIDTKVMDVLKLSIVNFDTAEAEKEPSKRRHMFAVRRLGLTQQQLRRFQVGFALFQRLQLAEQHRQLEQQQQQPAVGTPLASLTASAAAVDFSSSTGARLEAEQAAATALEKIFQKQRLISVLQTSFIFGTLSWQQHAKLRVLMSPFIQFGPMLAACILEHAAEVQRQQQQQQAKAKAHKKPVRTPAQQLVLGSEVGDDSGTGLGQGTNGYGYGCGSNTPAGQFDAVTVASRTA